jgi:SAM-dependent methyltransferase
MTASTASDLPWYETAFADLYRLIYPHRDDDSAEAEVGALCSALDIRGIGVRVLDVCCGGGRHAAAFARRGALAWGMDLSSHLLGRALERGELAGRLVRGDIRALPFAPAFDLVVNLFTSFGYFREERENQRALAEMMRVLRPGGRLVLDHINRAYVEHNLVEADEKITGAYHIRQRRWMDGNRVRKTITVTDGKGHCVEWKEDVRLYHCGELITLLGECGGDRIELWGDFSGVPLTPDSRRMIAVAVRSPKSKE